VIKPMFILAAAMIAAPALAQETPAAPAAPTLPFCSAKVTDNCQQTAAQQARAMSAEQAEKRNAAAGSDWSPNGKAATAKKPG
jgi:hypothetical protein